MPELIECKDLEEAKSYLSKALQLPKTTIIKAGEKRVAVINRSPNVIFDIFYLPLLPVESEELDLEKRISLALNKYGVEDNVIYDYHEIATELIDGVQVVKVTDVYRDRKEELPVPPRELSWHEFKGYANNLYAGKEENSNNLFTHCVVKIRVGKEKFNATFSFSPSEDSAIMVNTAVKLEEHPYYCACMTAMELCKHLIHFNITDAYDGFVTKGIKTGEKIMEFSDLSEDGEVYTCSYGLYVEIARGIVGRDVTQLVFNDNEFVRENLPKVLLIDFNFLGLKVGDDDIYKYFSNLHYEDEKVKEKLLKLNPINLRGIKAVSPVKDEKGNLVFKIGDYSIIRFAPRHEGWLKSVGLLKNTDTDLVR